MTKEKVLLITDSITSPTGFGNNGKSIAWALAKKYDVHVLGLGYFSNQDMKVNINMENDERTVIQHPNYPRGAQHNDWGYKSIPYLLDKHKPSAMISVLDINMVEHIPKILYPDTVKLKVMDLPAKKMVSQSALKMQLEGVMRKYKETYPRDVKWIQLAPVDGHPLMPKWKYTYQMADKTIAMSKYGRDVIKREFNMDVPFIWHGIDSSKFKATEKPDDCKGKFIIGDMNRNQQRKQPIRLLQAFAKFAKGKDDVYLHMQMDWNDKAGYPLMYWINMYGIGNKMVKPKPYGMSTDQIARTYNMWDVDVNPTAGEGFGLCLAESSFCGKPTIISDYTTSRELLMEGKPKPRGQLVKCDLEWEKLTQSACQRARIDIDDLVKAMNKYYHSRQMMERHGKNAQIWAKNNLAMKDLQYKWQDLVKKTLNED